MHDGGDYRSFTDEWGIGWQRRKSGGFCYDMYAHSCDVEDM
jgi:hypothetical protein